MTKFDSIETNELLRQARNCADKNIIDLEMIEELCCRIETANDWMDDMETYPERFDIETVYLDTETTGLDPTIDEIIEIAIIDDNNIPLVNTLIRPEKNFRNGWPLAQKFHGISPTDVYESKKKQSEEIKVSGGDKSVIVGGFEYAYPTLDDVWEKIMMALLDKRVVIYNASFDISFLRDIAEVSSQIQCCMLDFAKFIGAWDHQKGGYKWHKQVWAAQYVQHKIMGQAHRSLTDTMACRAIWRYVHDYDDERQRVDMLRATDGI